MRNFMIFLAILVVGIIAYQAVTPYLEEMGIDMNLTAVDDVDVEKHD
ncbi:MAG: Unknown protein [uncultured Sulfurovum sp.]|uniref:Uncharacterized protein n=1 Tax=uncultured Sulfurovum sp. TaxID=269237 RepID=A0A6S6SFM4_9BACT|nr:MAG: Unknown protein [uncultured Sulfurovum sp.]